MASASEGLDPEAFSHIPQEELEKLKAILKKGDLMVAEANTRGMQDNGENVSLNVAITQIPSSGKSSFISAVHTQNDGDEGGADIGVMKKTSKPAPLPHPKYPKVKLLLCAHLSTSRTRNRNPTY